MSLPKINRYKYTGLDLRSQLSSSLRAYSTRYRYFSLVYNQSIACTNANTQTYQEEIFWLWQGYRWKYVRPHPIKIASTSRSMVSWSHLLELWSWRYQPSVKDDKGKFKGIWLANFYPWLHTRVGEVVSPHRKEIPDRRSWKKESSSVWQDLKLWVASRWHYLTRYST